MNGAAREVELSERGLTLVVAALVALLAGAFYLGVEAGRALAPGQPGGPVATPAMSRNPAVPDRPKPTATAAPLPPGFIGPPARARANPTRSR